MVTIIESSQIGLGWKDLKYHLKYPMIGRETFHYLKMLQALSRLALDTSRNGEPQLHWAPCTSSIMIAWLSFSSAKTDIQI